MSARKKFILPSLLSAALCGVCAFESMNWTEARATEPAPAAVPKTSTGANGDIDPVEALREYARTHQSLHGHAKAAKAKRGKTKKKQLAGSGKSKGSAAGWHGWTTEVITKGKTPAAAKKRRKGLPPGALGGLGVPTAEEKAAAGQSDELLVPIKPQERNKARGGKAAKGSSAASEEHLALFVENRYPSAATCGVCHPKHYKEWSVSQHAYAQLSPAYLSLNNKINQLSNGSNGDFCLRCHSPVGANLGESPYASNLDRHPTSREGITCVVCHRINKAYNKASGRLALVEGGLTEPVFGPDGNAGVKNVLDKPSKFRVVTDPEKKGRQLHAEARVFNQIKTPVFCGTCHDVTLFNGFRLEEAYSEYRVSPAAARGETCQDCHMGKEQGRVSGYEKGPRRSSAGNPHSRESSPVTCLRGPTSRSSIRESFRTTNEQPHSRQCASGCNSITKRAGARRSSSRISPGARNSRKHGKVPMTVMMPGKFSMSSSSF